MIATGIEIASDPSTMAAVQIRVRQAEAMKSGSANTAAKLSQPAPPRMTPNRFKSLPDRMPSWTSGQTMMKAVSRNPGRISA